jgi:hypothetical protein
MGGELSCQIPVIVLRNEPVFFRSFGNNHGFILL